MVPVTHIGMGNMRFATPDGGMEPIGMRIVEIGADERRTELRDPYSGYIAYVPPGSVAVGEDLVTTGAGKTLPCTTCHGPELNGLANVPGIAERLPTYSARQMLDIKQGTRRGASAALMLPVVQNLTEEDIINIVAYLATLPPA